MGDDTCDAKHDWFTAVLTTGLMFGLVISYLPQHLRIINKQSSEGFSPWFLLLGSTSSASGMLNMITMQWGIIRCCRVWSFGTCLEMTLGVYQVSLQWLLFTIILILYMIYYPPHLKYVSLDVNLHDSHPPRHVKTAIRTDEWRLSIVLSWVVCIHIILITLITLFFLLTTSSSPDPSHRGEQISLWATFLGVTSAMLAAIQYAPQLVHTYKAKLVGALSIPMMLIQSPGAVLMVLSIALRPGTNWTSWITFAVAGLMQGSLLIICLFWKARQHRLGIDDFGNALPPTSRVPVPEIRVYDVEGDADGQQGGLGGAVERAMEGDVRVDNGVAVVHGDEREPLLGNGSVHGMGGGKRKTVGWFGWLRR